MKKITLILMLFLATAAFASDKTGQNNVTRADSMLTQFYDEVFGDITGQPAKKIDTTSVLRLLDKACLDASVDLYCVERDTMILTSSPTHWYSLPSDFYDVPPGLPAFGVVYFGGAYQVETALQPISIDQMGSKQQVASSDEVPSLYLIRKKKIYLEPVNNDNDSVKVYYAAYSNKLDSVTDTTNVDKEYIRYVVLKACETYLRAANWGALQAYANDRLAIVQGDLAKEERRLGITRESVMEKMIK